MSNTIVKNERREFKRHIVYDGAHALINLDKPIQGQIMNISREGLSLCYVHKDDPDKDNIVDVKTDIFLDNNGKFVAKLPCRIIWDRKISYSSTKGQSLIRECGVQFTDCSDVQITQLNYFFERDMTGSGSSRKSSDQD